MVLGVMAALVIVVLVLAMGAYVLVRSSLPILEGTIAASELAAPVDVVRDVRGVPTLVGRSRDDLAWALGFLHAQERYFQMDGQRRLAAGQVAELAGDAALNLDREVRVHRFRNRAATVLAAMTRDERRILDAYVAGVNRGLGALGAAPFEYKVLRSAPAPWTAEDTILTVYAMYLDLQERDGATERRRIWAREALGQPLASYLFPEGTTWDAALDGSELPTPVMPGRRAAIAPKVPAEPAGQWAVETISSGSNNWAVGGALSSHGAAIVANDMHLGLRVPNIWYRARLVLDDKDSGHTLTVSGVTLPGAPNIVAGSNGRIAWGFTNSFVDTSDVVILEPAEEGPHFYRTPMGPQALTQTEERICSRNGPCQILPVEESVWGPVIGADHHGRKLAYRWIAHDSVAVNLRSMLDLERAETASSALEIGPRLGIPHQNLVVGDAQGNVGWTVTSALPQRVGFDGREPVSWADGTRRWSGYVEPQETPRIYNPESRRIWTANSRVVGGEALATLGFGAYAHGSRARQIRDRLFAKNRFDEHDMLMIQLDDRGVLLERWQALMLQQLRANAQYASLMPQVESWGGRATPDSVGYRLVRTFRIEAIRAVYDGLTVPMRAREAARSDRHQAQPIASKQADEPAWRLLTERPAHMVPVGYQDWDAVLNSAIAKTMASVSAQSDGKLDAFTWGAANRAEIRHPLTRAVPGLSYFLDPPNEPQPGDLYQPRVAAPASGASERFVVAPGHEATGIFHMPTSQTGHPLSPYYNVGHDDWAQGRATPFLPGAPKWHMVFQPSRAP